MPAERLQKLLARAGVASRRHAEELIRAGRVSVSGRIVTELGTRADPQHDRIEVDGRRIVAEAPVYIVLHKPRAVMCTLSDPEGRKTVAELVGDLGTRVVPVGRLDYHTSGALLMSNDGDFAAALSHPKHGVQKVYVAKVRGVVGDVELERFRQSIVIDGRATRPAAVRLMRVESGKSWLEVTLSEGRNRQVRRLGDAAGLPVLRLVRVAHAGISAEGLKPGEWRSLTRDELVALKRVHGVPRSVRAGAGAPSRGGREVAPSYGKRGPGRSPRSAASPTKREGPRGARPSMRSGSKREAPRSGPKRRG